MYSTLIVPLDGSAFAAQAVDPAAFLSRRSRATLLLLHVHEGPHNPGYRTPTWDEFFRNQEEAYLEAVAARFQPDLSGNVEWSLLDGHVVTAICARVEAAKAPLVVMSTHGRTGIRRAWLGGVATDVLRHSSAPVLMLRPRSDAVVPDRASTEAPFANVIVALDGSAFAEEVLCSAADVARASNARLVFLRVVDPKQSREDSMREANAYLDGLVRRGGNCYSSADARVEAHAAPGAAILAHAAGHERSLVAMASHGRGLSRLFLGSVADEVMRGAPGAVLMVRPRT